MTEKFLLGDCRETLKEVDDGVVQTCITSPPYFGLRDYGHGDQIGLEQTPEAFVAGLLDVFREVKRVLRDDGTLWLNLGDTYVSTSQGSVNAPQKIRGDNANINAQYRPKIEGLKSKDLIGIPWKVAFALQADGWYLRQDIIWNKPNPMPESVTDRCTKSHEYIFLLSKSQKYFYDHEAIKENSSESSKQRLSQDIKNQEGSKRVPFKTNGTMKAVGSEARNKRSVWTVTTKPYKEAHFATYPPELITPCVLAGSRPGEIVLDPFTGAGTTAMVAKENSRGFIGCELNPEYLEIARNRIANTTPGLGI